MVPTCEVADPEAGAALAVGVDRGGILPHAVGGGAERVLGDGEDGRVGVDGEGGGAHVWDRGAHNKGGFEDGPGCVGGLSDYVLGMIR